MYARYVQRFEYFEVSSRLTLAKREAQMGSTSGTPAALIRELSLSACKVESVSMSSVAMIIHSLISRNWKVSYSDVEAVIGEDECGVGGSEFGDRHLD